MIITLLSFDLTEENYFEPDKRGHPREKFLIPKYGLVGNLEYIYKNAPY